MKRMGYLSAMVLAGALTLPAQAGETKIAVVDATRLLKQYYKTELADSQMQTQVEDFTSERDKLLAEHKRLKKEFEQLRAEAQDRALSDEARDKKKEQAEDKLTEVITYEDSIRDKATSRRKQLEGEGRRMQQELVKSIRGAVQTYARKNGYNLVLDSSGMLANGFEGVVFSDEKMDVTEDVLKVLNADRPADMPVKRTANPGGPGKDKGAIQPDEKGPKAGGKETP